MKIKAHFKCGKLIFVNKRAKHVLLIGLVKRKYMNHLKDISCQNNKNNNGNKLKRYVIRYQMEINKKLEK